MENHKRKSQCNEITYKKLSRNLILGCSYYLRQGSFFMTSR
ncbi:hypothetical protein HMPREF1366_02619 [Enterococcus faecium ERV26]|nr:hypothetical protein HMPREF1368_02618 [Enterococcus faecium ERV69]EJX89798.1 hypothetical protein HMPREF1366_02619 [Enterococcus faecium ERV26]EJY28739.1 hypothetical protein HMPREF1354_02088 [Enterococcus faecium 514]